MSYSLFILTRPARLEQNYFDIQSLTLQDDDRSTMLRGCGVPITATRLLPLPTEWMVGLGSSTGVHPLATTSDLDKVRALLSPAITEIPEAVLLDTLQSSNSALPCSTYKPECPRAIPPAR